MTLPTQTTASTRNYRRVSTMDSSTKIGIERLSSAEKSKLISNYYSRRTLLTVPQDIQDANPDKYFVYINYNTLEKNGFYHSSGYRIYKSEKDSESLKSQKFDETFDGMVHRNEMVLAYLPKEEWEQRQLEEAVVRSLHHTTDALTQSEALRGFSPHAKETSEQVQFTK